MYDGYSAHAVLDMFDRMEADAEREAEIKARIAKAKR